MRWICFPHFFSLSIYSVWSIKKDEACDTLNPEYWEQIVQQFEKEVYYIDSYQNALK